MGYFPEDPITAAFLESRRQTVNPQNKLMATAYILDQTDVIKRSGISPKEALEGPFGAYKTFQVKISEVERLTHLTFTLAQRKSP